MTSRLDWTGVPCVGKTDLFFLEPGESSEPAKKICATCPFVDECLDYSLTFPHPWHGIFGGKTVRERKRIAANRDRLPRVFVLIHGTETGYHGHRRRNETPCSDCRRAHAADQRARKAARRAAVGI